MTPLRSGQSTGEQWRTLNAQGRGGEFTRYESINGMLRQSGGCRQRLIGGGTDIQAATVIDITADGDGTKLLKCTLDDAGPNAAPIYVAIPTFLQAAPNGDSDCVIYPDYTISPGPYTGPNPPITTVDLTAIFIAPYSTDALDPDGHAIVWQDTNRDARSWAYSIEVCEGGTSMNRYFVCSPKFSA